MKLVLQAIIGSIVIHVIYIVGRILIGYINTRNYKPDIAVAWDKVETLQNEVVFGKVFTPGFDLLSFVGVAVICGILILIYKNIFK